MFRISTIVCRITVAYAILLVVAFCHTLSAQTNPNEQKNRLSTQKYIVYTAVSGDSPYSIARKFGVSMEELQKANPEILEKLNSGQTVKIPFISNENSSKESNGLQNDDSEDRLYIYHSVRKKETVFSIAQKRNVTTEDIYQNNPQSREGIKEGEVLKIPKPFVSEMKSKAALGNNQQPVKHVVKRKESLFSIARKYNTTQEEILKMNPTVSGSISKGTVLIIPGYSDAPVIPAKSQEGQKYREYQIVNGDNYFQLGKRFGISQNELEQLNPSLKNGFNSGMIIRIPVNNISDSNTIPINDNQLNKNQPTKNQPTEYSATSITPFSYKNQNKTFQIGVYLPLYQNLNDTSGITQRTASFLEFYSGVLLASEKMTEAGMKLKLFVYDTYQDSKMVEKLVNKPEFLSLDLIIGPVYPANQKIVAELCGKNRIPMVSPLSSDSRFVSTTPGYYLINPGRKLRLAGTADFIANKFADQNIILLNHGTITGDVKVILDRLSGKPGLEKIRQYNILAQGTSGLEAMLKPDKENIIILADGNEANVSVAMTRLNTISKSHRITVIGLQEYTKMQSIDIEHLHNTRLHYLSPYFVDYGNPNVNLFIAKYRADFGSEPSQYSFQGYDIALHFIASLGKSGKNFPETNPIPGVDLLQADYRFNKISDLGGYMNQTLYVVEYTDAFEVKSAGKINGIFVPDTTEGGEKNGIEQ